MRALVFDGRLALRDDYPAPTPGPGEALIAVRLAGVCKTDLEIVKGYMGFRGVLGHEFVGAALQGPPHLAGRRVVGEINCPCRQCDLCAEGLGNHCRRRTVLGIAGRDGVFADQTVLPAANLRALPDNVSDEQAVFVEPLAAAFQVLQQVTINPADHVVVLGDGRLGQLVARVIKTVNPRVVLVGKHPAKLELARRQGIATAALAGFVADAGAHVVVEATGRPAGFELAMKTVRPRGTIVLKSTFAADSGLNLAPLVIHEVTVVGSRCGPFDRAVEALADGRVEVTDLISLRLALAEGPAILAAAASGDNLKVLVKPRTTTS